MGEKYRVGGKQPRNIYRVNDEHPEGAYIGVFFDEEDAALVVSGLNMLLDIADDEEQAALIRRWSQKHAAANAKLEGREVPTGYVRSPKVEQYLEYVRHGRGETNG